MLLQLILWVEFAFKAAAFKAALIHFKILCLAALLICSAEILQESYYLLEAARISLVRGLCNNLTFEAILQLSHL